MKIQTILCCLKNLTNSPLPILSNDDIAQTFENDVPNRPFSDVSEVCNWTSPTSPLAFNTKLQNLTSSPCHDSIRDPHIFRTPCFPTSLFNLSLSQPVTPRTPAIWKNFGFSTTKTPCISQRHTFLPHDNFVIPTPMIVSSLRSLSRSNGPDILQLIDDDTADIESVNRNIAGYADVDLDDNNVVDYLLNLSDDALPTHQSKLQVEKDIGIHTKRRKGRHAKRMTEEESNAYRERRKLIEKERKKGRIASFTREEKGITRRSKRSRKNGVKYK